ncbi:MAG: hypothetical protein ACR2QH_13105 [Geminicoccaceae bacterium]
MADREGHARMNGIQSELIDETLHITMPRVLDIPAAADLKDVVLEMVEPEMAVAIQSADVDGINAMSQHGCHLATDHAGFETAELLQ